MKKMRIIVAIAVLAMLGVTQVNAQSAQATGNASAQIMSALECNQVEGEGLRFGGIFASENPGTVTIAPNSTRTEEGGVALFAGLPGGAARFSIVAPSDNVAVTLPANDVVTIVLDGDPGVTMAINDFTSNADAGGILDVLNADGELTVGGTLSVGANQLPGLYTGTFNVSIQAE